MTDELATLRGDLAKICAKEDTHDFLTSLRQRLTQPDVKRLIWAWRSNTDALTVIYFLNKVLNDLFANLGVDASFEFPASSPKLIQVAEGLRNIVRWMSAAEEKVKLEGVWSCFSLAVGNYFACLAEINENLLRGKRPLWRSERGSV